MVGFLFLYLVVFKLFKFAGLLNGHHLRNSLVDHMFSLYCVYCNISYFPFLFYFPHVFISEVYAHKSDVNIVCGEHGQQTRGKSI